MNDEMQVKGKWLHRHFPEIGANTSLEDGTTVPPFSDLSFSFVYGRPSGELLASWPEMK